MWPWQFWAQIPELIREFKQLVADVHRIRQLLETPVGFDVKTNALQPNKENKP